MLSMSVFSQEKKIAGYWQQNADYKIEVKMNVKDYKYTGSQEVIYTNNSPDTLHKIYFHLFNNAFQPNSEMDCRLRYIKDPDGRMVTKFKVNNIEKKESRIAKLQPNESGFLHLSNIKQDNENVDFKEIETIAEILLNKPLLPGEKTTLSFNFEGQVPIQIRRSGRNNKEGIELSMAQWYPKVVEYDFEGWHATSYISREFHGVWGNFDVKITIDKNYILGGTGYLQNGNQIGYNYQDKGVEVKIPKKTKELTWHFLAPNVHDFTWAADKEYIHDVYDGPNDVKLHFLYKNNPKIIENWKNLQPKAAQIMTIYNNLVGHYPYKQYSVIQGGDGGMEYAMCTLILGEGSPEGLLGVTAHEMGHSWFQGVLAFNEGKHAWMDEGFTTYIEDYALNELAENKSTNPFLGSYKSYYYLVNSGKEQPLSTHSDRYDENMVYSINSYSKGSVFLCQLEYLLGKENLHKTLKKLYETYQFKHPTPNDVKRIAEKISGAHLDWYLVDWTQTTNTIDYAIKNVTESDDKTTILLERIGRMPMPIEVNIEFEDGSNENYYIPFRLMYFAKPNFTVLNDWTWGNPEYEFSIPKNKKTIQKITLDKSLLMADIKQDNNVYNKK